MQMLQVQQQDRCGLALFADGTEIIGTEMNTPVTTAGEYSNIGFNKKIRVCCKGTVNLSINSVPTITTSVTGTPVVTDTQIPVLKNANINIERLS